MPNRTTPTHPTRRDDQAATSRRPITVNDPHLSENSNRLLTDELRATVGSEPIDVPVDRPHPSQGERPLTRRLLSPANGRLLIRSMLTAAIVVAMIIVLAAVNAWWLLVVAVLILAAATASITSMVMRMIKAREHPSAETSAALQEDGVRDPDRLFTVIVDEFDRSDHDRPAGDQVA